MTQMPPPTQPGPVQHLQPHRGVLILVFGILSWVVCFIFGIVAWVMGNGDLRAMREGRMDPSGEGLTQAGKIVGMIHIIISIIAIPVMIILFMIGAFAAAASSGAAGGAGP